MFKISKVAFYTILSSCSFNPLTFHAAVNNTQWSYVGMNAGGALVDAQYKTKPNCASSGVNGVFCEFATPGSLANGDAVAAKGTDAISTIGINTGIHAGHNWFINDYLYGAEADVGLVRFEKSNKYNGVFPFAFLGNAFILRESVSTTWLTTIRGRAGFTVDKISPNLFSADKILFYGTAGSALTEIKVSSKYSDNAIGGGLPGGYGKNTRKQLKLGWVLGAGSEVALTDSLSLKLEYLHVNFDTTNLSVSTYNTLDFIQRMKVKFDLNENIVRLAIDYKFDSFMNYLKSV